MLTKEEFLEEFNAHGTSAEVHTAAALAAIEDRASNAKDYQAGYVRGAVVAMYITYKLREEGNL